MSAPGDRGWRAGAGRRSLLVAAALLFPVCTVSGTLAPNLVEVALRPAPAAQPAGPLPEVSQRRAFDPPPLKLPGELFPASLVNPLDLAQLFAEIEYSAADDRRHRAALLSFPHDRADAIVLDDVGRPHRELAFLDVPAAEAPMLDPLPDPDALLLPLCGVLDSSTCLGEDAFAAVEVLGGAVVPEPGSGVLVGLGIALLALAGRDHPGRPFSRRNRSRTCA